MKQNKKNNLDEENFLINQCKKYTIDHSKDNCNSFLDFQKQLLKLNNGCDEWYKKLEELYENSSLEINRNIKVVKINWIKGFIKNMKQNYYNWYYINPFDYSVSDIFSLQIKIK